MSVIGEAELMDCAATHTDEWKSSAFSLKHQFGGLVAQLHATPYVAVPTETTSRLANDNPSCPPATSFVECVTTETKTTVRRRSASAHRSGGKTK
jgi:hypothetical protein